MWEYANNHPVWFFFICVFAIIGITDIIRSVSDVFKNKGDSNGKN